MFLFGIWYVQYLCWKPGLLTALKVTLSLQRKCVILSVSYCFMVLVSWSKQRSSIKHALNGGLRGCTWCFGTGFWIDGGKLDWMIYLQMPWQVWCVASLIFDSPHTNLANSTIWHFFHILTEFQTTLFSAINMNKLSIKDTHKRCLLKFRKWVSRIVRSQSDLKQAGLIWLPSIPYIGKFNLTPPPLTLLLLWTVFICGW